ncbi:phosphatidylinositol kinase- protein kinase tor1 [Massospora cicadina]|nr:phosphatidylinositol kinase- protein kinase tor1 [Massospora cicadina]
MASLSARTTEALDRIFSDLKSRSDETRLKGGEALKQFYEEASVELPTSYAEIGREINRRITDLLKSNEPNDKIGGIVAIDKMISTTTDVSSNQSIRFINFLRPALPCNDTQVMVMASKTLGKLALSGETLTANSIDFEIKRALEWLQAPERFEPRRHAAVLILKELSQTAPIFIYSYVGQIVELIWVVLRDPKLAIRESGAEALTACLKIVYIRDYELKKAWYSRLLDEVHRGLKLNTLEAIHGSLLALKELLIDSGMFMKDYYRDAGDIVLNYKDHRELLIRKTVITLIPLLASYNPTDFASLYLQKTMVYLISQLHKEREKSESFYAVGHVAVAVGTKVTPFIDAIFQCIKDTLSPKGAKVKMSTDPSIFECIGNLSVASGASLTKHSNELLDLMFSSEIHEPLHRALVSLGKNIPFAPRSDPRPTFEYDIHNLEWAALCSARHFASFGPHEIEQITLALTSLGTFNFDGHHLSEFVRDSLLHYLDCDSLEVRKLAALTCCRILAKDPICHQTSSLAIEVMNEILNKLLSAGIADPDPSVRHTVLTNLDSNFNRHLSQANNVRFLFMALNDEAFNNRKAAITVIGRLAAHNPAYVVPSLRKILIQLLTNLEYSDVSRNKEESAILLGLIVNAAHQFVKPYIESIVGVLLDKASSASPGVVASVMTALGELAEVGGDLLARYLDDLMPMVIEALQDQASLVKRNAALKTLGQLTSSTGYVIEPYFKYPKLLGILTNILKTEQAVPVRREVIRVMGVLGALDPFRQEPLPSPEKMAAAKSEAKPESTEWVGPAAEDYYPRVAVAALMRVLTDATLSAHHSMVIQAFMYIFKTLGLKCAVYLPQLLPAWLSVIRTGNHEFYFQQLGILVSIVKQHIRAFLPDILALVKEFWHSTASIQRTLINLIEAISDALAGDFKVYVPTLLPNLLQAIDGVSVEKQSLSIRVLQTLVSFGSCTEDYAHLILPVVVRVIERPDTPLQVKRAALHALAELCKNAGCCDLASMIVHPLARTLALPVPELRSAVLDVLCVVAYQLGHDYAVFVPLVNRAMIHHRIQHHVYDSLVARILRNELPMPEFTPTLERDVEAVADHTAPPKLNINEPHLKKAWSTYQRTTRDDWIEWFRRFSVELIKESPSHAVRACYTLASAYHPLAKELFNAAFVSCWCELPNTHQEDLVLNLEAALVSPASSNELVQIILCLAEFMERNDKKIPINLRTLGAYASRSHAFAKALHYKELEFILEPCTATIESLISINNTLQLPDAAVGVLTIAQNHHNHVLEESWYEKLGRWDEALMAYDRRADTSPFSVALGRMRCYHALGEWNVLSSLVAQHWPETDDDMRQAVAPLAAAAEWGIGRYDMVQHYTNAMKPNSADHSFFQAILALHARDFERVRRSIDTARDLLDTELTALISESFSRAYHVLVRVQTLSEIEEVIRYMTYADQPERQVQIRRAWVKRLRGCQRNVDVWQRTLQVHSMVIQPQDDVELWIKFANLCRKSGRLLQADRTLRMLLKEAPPPDAPPQGAPQVVYAYLKHRWASGGGRDTLSQLQAFTQQLTNCLKLQSVEPHSLASLVAQPSEEGGAYLRLLSRCHHRQGKWLRQLQDYWDETSIPAVLNAYYLATQLDPQCYKAWHAWALANFEVIGFYEQVGAAKPELVSSHVVPAVQGFFQSVRLSHVNSLQDTLRLLTLWFKYAPHADVNMAITEGFNNVSFETWLQVIPQLIARIHAPSPNVRRLVHHILHEVGRVHPQALIYPVTVASNSLPARKDAHPFPRLVEQAQIVSQELIRVAILWHELWYEGLEEASRLYFGEHNIDAMFKTLEPLHAMLVSGPETLREVSFNQAFGRDLQEAYEWCLKYRQTRNINDLNQAWDLYYQVFRRINKQLPNLTSLELQHVSPKLLAAENLELVIPGSYRSGMPVVRIAGFSPVLTVITSKQRPRRLGILGDDGIEHRYLLKGHEDLRQDERVMQLFGLVNTLLASDAETFKRRLSIERYPVIPLSPNSGLIGWLPHCDTLHTLVRDYREHRKILLNIEHRLMLQLAPDYDNLTLLQKVEVFEYSLENTLGQDLYRVLWLKSQSAEAWLDRRTNFTRSLALMSIVGYILGLGDRHPSNLMLDRRTGRSSTLTLGTRIPFRLTRMLTNAMEVSGLEGTFRITCENVMRLLRDNKESVMAVLEAFVYDPLINWRLMSHPSPKAHTKSAEKPFPRSNLEELPDEYKPEVLNQRAVMVISRVSNKLSGRDFNPNLTLDTQQQVEQLIRQATSIENLSAVCRSPITPYPSSILTSCCLTSQLHIQCFI